MNTISRISITIALASLLSACTLPFGGRKAGLQVASNPQANVTVDDKPLGQTPVYQENLESGSHNIKIVSSDPTLLPWEGKVTLSGGVLTIVDRQLASEANKSHGYILSFEKLGNNSSAEVNIISLPDTVSVAIDGAPVGFTPFKSDAVTAGAHTFTLSSPGYQEKTFKASVQSGYRLVISAQLAVQSVVPTPTPTPEPSVTATPSGTPKVTPKTEVIVLPKQSSASAALVAKPYVEILETPTGFLRVRAEANTGGEEVARVNPGDRYPYLKTDGSWYQIEYQDGRNGWISATYAKLVN